jgi:putative tryptophan/tyrosine transport system substrate-binding protein
VTGLSLQAPDAAGKRLEFLREILPGMRRLGIIEDPASGPEGGEIAALAQRFGIEVTAQRIKQGADIPMAFDALRGRADALYLGTGPLVNTHRTSINTLAVGAGLATISGVREYIEAGGLMSYGPNYPDLFRRAAAYVDKILRGAKPGDLPVEQPTTFQLVVNLTTAKALGLTIPPTLLARADEVIE